METQFLRKTSVIVLMTVLVYSLTGAVLPGDGCPVPPPDEYNELQSHCNATTNISQANATLFNLHDETFYDGIRRLVIDVCIAANVCDPDNPPPPKKICPSANKDFLNRRLSVQVVKLQQLNNSLCMLVRENTSGNTEDSNACKRLQKQLHEYIMHIDDHLRMVKCGCADNMACYYQPGTEIKGTAKSQTLKEILIEIYYTINYIGGTIKYEYDHYEYYCAL